MEGPDHKASLEPHELKAMVAQIRAVEKAKGSTVKKPSEIELANRNIARKSIVAKIAIQKGELLSENNLCVKRPGTGINPANYWSLIGTAVVRDYNADDLI